jgi:hypothetical protein
MFQAARALELFVFRYQRRDTESLHETMSRFERAKPGQRALLWLLKSNAVRDIAFLKHPTLLRAISHCLVAEGGFRWLQDWLTQEDNPLSSLTDPEVRELGQPDNFWRGRLLLHTMEAQAYWTRNPLFLVEPLKTFASIIDHVVEQRTFMSFSMAGKWLETTIMSAQDNAPILSEPTFMRYLRNVRFWDQSADLEGFRIAKLLTKHPTQPDGDMLLGILKLHQHSAHPIIQAQLEPTNPLGNKSLFSALIHLAKLLAQQGSLTDAHWVLDFGRVHMPDIFTGFHVAFRERSTQDQGGLKRWRRKPTPREVAEGLGDAQGNWIKTDDNKTPGLIPDRTLAFRRGG